MIGPRFFQQTECPQNIGTDEIIRTMDRTIHMTFRRKVDDGARLMLLEQSPQKLAIAHVSLNEAVSRISSNPNQVAEIARVRELVEVDHRSLFLRDPLQDEVGTDESGPSGHQDRFFHVRRSRRTESWSFGDAALIVLKM